MSGKTIVCVHAHPDDETLLMGGTLARASAEGNRTVVITATDGARGLAAGSVTRRRPLGAQRLQELENACTALGVDRLVTLGYPDSGQQFTGSADRFVDVAVNDVAKRVAAVLVDERADVVTGYDPAGGYGHPDHRHVHRVARRAAELAETPMLLEVTVDRQALQRALRTIEWLPGLPDGFCAAAFDDRFTATADLTHRHDVRRFADRKRDAMLAHVSQRTADAGDRTLAWSLRLPRLVYRRVFGTEWFVEPGANRAPGTAPSPDPFTSSRPVPLT